jgi:hypothetical protein
MSHLISATCAGGALPDATCASAAARLRGKNFERAIHRVAADDRNAGESGAHLSIAAGMIEVPVGVDDGCHRLAASLCPVDQSFLM